MSLTSSGPSPGSSPRQTRPPHILIIEDDAVTRATLASYLDSHGYRVSEADTSEKAERILEDVGADLLIVDINLQGKDGLEITREQRAQSEIGIILVTGRTDDVDRIVGLELGADDYVCKPFNRRELLARIKNLLRRTAGLRRNGRRSFGFAGFVFDVTARQLVDATGQSIALTRAEYELLRLMVNHHGQVLTRDRLRQGVTLRSEDATGRTIDVLVRRLRMKLGDDPRAPRIIATAHGEGYVFTAPLT